RRLDQGAAVHRVVAIIFERLFDRFRHDDRSGEMHDALDAMFGDDPADQRYIANVALHEGGILMHGPAEAGAQIIDHHYRPARIDQRQHRMAADIACAAGDEDGGLVAVHDAGWSLWSPQIFS